MRLVNVLAGPSASLLAGGVSAGMVLALGAVALGVARRIDATSPQRRLRGAPVSAPPAWFESGVRALELPVSPAAAWPWATVTSAVVAVLLALRAPLHLLGLLALAAAAGTAAQVRRRRTSFRDLDRDLPVLLDDAVAAMASGSSLLQGLSEASRREGTLGAELEQALRLRSRGVGLQEVLDDWAARRPASSIGLFADALALADVTGGSQVGALRSVGDTLREREALQREVRAMAAQAQLSASVLVVAPVAFAAVVAVLDHRIAAFLLTSPPGWACLVGGAALDAAGAWWMRRLVRSVS